MCKQITDQEKSIKVNLTYGVDHDGNFMIVSLNSEQHTVLTIPPQNAEWLHLALGNYLDVVKPILNDNFHV